MRLLSLYIIVAFILTITSCAKDKIAGDWQGDTFIKYYGHVYNQTAADIIKTPDNGYLILGTSSSYVTTNNSDRSLMNKIYLVKTDSIGNELWSKTYGDNNYNVIGKQIMPNSDSSAFIIMGTAQYIDRSTSVSVAKHTRMVFYKIDDQGVIDHFRYYPDNFLTDLNYDFVSAARRDNEFMAIGTTTAVDPIGKAPVFDPNIDKTDYYALVLNFDLDYMIGRTTIQGIYGEDQAVKVLAHPSLPYYLVITNAATPNNEYRTRIAIYDSNSNLASNTIDGNTDTPDNDYLATDASIDIINNKTYLTILATKNNAPDLKFTNPIGMGFLQFELTYDNNFGLTLNRTSATRTPMNSSGSNDYNYPTKSGKFLVYPNDNGYLVSSTVTKLSGINTDIQLTRYNLDFQIQWTHYFGSGASMDDAGKLFFIDSLIPNSSLRPIVGIGGIGTFDFGSNNTMIGFFKANTKGELKANE